MPVSYLTLEVRVLVFPELDTPLPVERPSLDGLEALLVLSTPEPVTIKLQGDTRAFFSSVLSRPLRGELLQSHLLRKNNIREVSSQRIAILRARSNKKGI